MSQYIAFSDEQKLRANAVDLERFLEQQGETLIRSGREKRLKSDHSVTVRGNEWYDHAMERGGGPVAFVQYYYGKPYPEAISMLLGNERGEVYPVAREKKPDPPKPFELPPKNVDMRRVYAYLLKERHIHREVINYFVRAGTLYEDVKHHNCVFTGFDENDIPRHAHKRSTNSYGESFRINVEGCDPRYSFHHIGTDGSLFVFEAPIDMLSYISLYLDRWQEHSYVACCGVSFQPVEKMLELMPRVDTVYLCLDNDDAGHKASERMAKALAEKGIRSERLVSDLKDWNDDLKKQSQEETQCQQMCGPS